MTINRGWQEEEIDIIRAGLKAQMPTSWIASKLPGRTRNAVIGAIHRRPELAKLQTRTQSPVRRPRRDTRGDNGRAQAIHRAKKARVKPPKIESPEPVVPPPDAPEPKHLALEDLQHRQCKWPFGDGPFTFCGHATAEGKVYCDHHEDRAINHEFMRRLRRKRRKAVMV